MSFERFLQLIKDREPVSAGTANRPTRQLDQNVRYLWEIIQAANLGSTVYARQVTVEPDALVGMPVYLNPTTQRFERGLATMDTDGVTGVIMSATSASIWGVVSDKHNSTLADLLLFGYARLNISQAVTGAVEPGTYYLSGVTPGMLVQQRPPVSVPVLRAGINGYVFVNPSFVDFLDAHRHYRFDLHCVPAGLHTPPTPGDRHVITGANADWPGWLPADHASFDGKAPAGAVFGYNLRQHTALYSAWPPLPLAHCYLDWIKDGDPDEGYEGVPLGTGGQCIIDRNGIWWMSDCYGDVPWPTSLETTGLYSESVASENTPPECPRDVHMSLVLWFTKITFANDATVVTSIRSTDDRLKVYCRGTSAEGYVGDLDIDLDLNLTMGVDTARGYLAMKILNGEKIDRGPVVEGLYALTENVQLTSPFQTPVDPDDPEGTQQYHGPVGISVLPSAVSELQAQLTRLEGATEENNPVLYVGMNPDTLSQFVSKFEIPVTAPVSNAQFAFRGRIIGRTAGTLPQLVVEYLKTSRPTTSPVTVDGTWSSLSMTTVATTTEANQAVEATSDPIAVSPGDIVYVRVTRDPAATLESPPTDDYAGEIGFMQQVGIVTVAES